MAFQIPNLDKISKEDPKLGEALQKVQVYVGQNVTTATGNKQTPPSGFVNPSGT